MRRVRACHPLLVGPAPGVFDALHARAIDRAGTAQGPNLSSGALTIGGEPSNLPGLNEGIFYPREDMPPGRAALTPGVPGRRRPTTGAARCLILLVDFADNPGRRDPTEVRDMLFSEDAYPTGSMRDFYRENSYGQLDVEGTVLGWLRMPHPYTYYVDGQRGLGAYPQNTQTLVEDALGLAAQQVDVRQFDADGDGYLDGLFVVHAGEGAEAEVDPSSRVQKIWSHQWNLRHPIVSAGIGVYAYCATPEDGRIGVFCHEFGHMLGLPDLYDTTYRSSGVGQWCVMGTGNWNDGGQAPAHFCAWAKARLGWLTPTVVTEALSLRLEPIAGDATGVYRLWTGGTAGDEYYLIENRRLVGFDRSLPGDGLLVWRVDEAQDDNARPGRYLVGLEQADGRHDLEQGRNTGDNGDPFPGRLGVTEFDAAHAPVFDPGRARSDGVSVTSIQIQSAGGVITCRAAV